MQLIIVPQRFAAMAFSLFHLFRLFLNCLYRVPSASHSS